MSRQKTFSGLKEISTWLSGECRALKFNPPVEAVYSPLEYAVRPHELYLKLAGASPKKVIFLGMNPGPWGMTQTGVPFGEIPAVQDWLEIKAAVDKPAQEHPKRPIEGFACRRSEVSGRRLWGLFKERFGTPAVFFQDHYVANYCPLVFMNINGKNLTPDSLPKKEALPLFALCDKALADTIELLQPQWLIGIGGFAKKKIDQVQKQFFSESKHQFSTAQILHPSPANPRANAGWETEVVKTLTDLGIWN